MLDNVVKSLKQMLLENNNDAEKAAIALEQAHPRLNLEQSKKIMTYVSEYVSGKITNDIFLNKLKNSGIILV